MKHAGQLVASTVKLFASTVDSATMWGLCVSGILWATGGVYGAEERAEEAAPKFSARQLEHFEKKIRPLLSKRCYECHSAKADRLEASLYLDSRSGMLEGGDTGPAIVPGDAEASLLVDTVRYGDIYQMPPSGKLPPEEIRLLVDWINDGAPWPIEADSATTGKRDEFDLQARMREHWVWRPMQEPTGVDAEPAEWGHNTIDNFILARLNEVGLQPSKPADKRTLMRRVYFDLIGLPPTPAELNAYLNDSRPGAYERLVDRLLESPHFGERWARHWLDLVRFAESRGHEFDYDTPNAFEYRDYVIRALNADVPYDQFVLEHLAGDLLDEPRRNPDSGFNESLLGTGFWFLGEWVHSPVDIRKDEADRHDNMIDVFGKTFLGMTIACARCHDHKFDPISQRDYYAMSGFLQSSCYRQARFETLDHNRQVARQLEKLRGQIRDRLNRSWSTTLQPALERSSDYLLAARTVLTQGPAAADHERHVTDAPGPSAADVVFEDFEDGNYDGWTLTGDAFGDGPQTQQTIADYQGNVGAAGRFFVNSHQRRGPQARGDDHVGTMTSQPFRIERDYIHFLIGGGAHVGRTSVNLRVDDQTVLTATGRNANAMQEIVWDVRPWRNREARLQIVDAERGGWGNIGFDHVVFTNTSPAGSPDSTAGAAWLVETHAERIEQVARAEELDAKILSAWVEQIAAARSEDEHPLRLWAEITFAQSSGGEPVAEARETAFDLSRHVQREADTARQRLQSHDHALDGCEVIYEYCGPLSAAWIQDGSTFGLSAIRAGELQLGSDPRQPLNGVAAFDRAERASLFANLRPAPGAQNDGGKLGKWVRAGRTLRTPTFTLDSDAVHYLVAGRGYALAVVDSHRMINGPLHGNTVHEWDAADGRLHWVTQQLGRYRGHRMHLEFSPHESDPLGVVLVVQGPRPRDIPFVTQAADIIGQGLASGTVTDVPALAQMYQQQLTAAVRQVGQASRHEVDPAAAVLADWVARHDSLFFSAADRQNWISEAAPYVRQLTSLAERVRNESRLAPAMWDGLGENEHVMIRGSHLRLGAEVSRSILTALRARPEFQTDTASGAAGAGGDAGAVQNRTGSGRLELARRVIDPANPLTARVAVNRLWHHVFGRGLVASVDNFGVLGQEPTHPQLLDYLALEFIRDGWSIKRMLRRMVLSQTYRQSSTPNPAAADRDAANLLLHRMRIRRLQAEAVRDAMLTVSGRLDRDLYGPSVPVHLTSFMQGRGRPRSGPLDGSGRRSIYISIRRNFLSPMMLAFDMPQPFSTVGRRTVSNVPAQALILMNDPFVIEQAGHWAQRLLAGSERSAVERIMEMYDAAFARQPTPAEIEAALAFLEQQGERLGVAAANRQSDPRLWADLCHVLFNVKEFVFVN